MKIDTEILLRSQENIPSNDIRELSEVIKRYYHFSAPEFWMWKMFQFGFVYGKRAERARRKKTA
ncbi:hypothetical protein DWX08_10370 [Ruminococcus sp. AF18-22]|jgi:hypothetical protein|nr:hypothetical protein DWX08_10370 [Ruminococcus sp. AF18-22]DAS83861.1 MAG TPA: hypothetical protein [Caudoviricetes sp.]